MMKIIRKIVCRWFDHRWQYVYECDDDGQLRWAKRCARCKELLGYP